MLKSCCTLFVFLATQVKGDGCQKCASEDAGNCYHSSWPGKSYDKCSKEKSAATCEKNDNGVWCPGPSPGPSPTPSPSPGGKDITITSVTFYGYPDNCPPSAQPHSLGIGTYEDPITFAGPPSAIPSGTIMYIKHFKKYFIMDDECEECEEDWKKHGTWHTDLWLGPNHMKKSYTRLVGCEDSMTTSNLAATLNPSKNLTVDTTPFYDPANDKCMKPADPCYETCNAKVECNECDGLSGSCGKIANIFSLSVECFQKLNPKIDCGKGDKALHGQTFCQGSGCPLKNQLNFFEVV